MALDTVAEAVLRIDANTKGLSNGLNRSARTLRSFQTIGRTALISVAASSGIAAASLAGVGTAAAAAGVIVSGAMAGAVVGIGAVGIAAAATSRQVQDAFSSMAERVGDSLQDLATPFEGVLIDFAHGIEDLFQDLSPVLRSIFSDLAPVTMEFFDSLLSSAGTFVRGMADNLEKMIPVARAIFAQFEPITQAVVDGFGIMADAANDVAASLGTNFGGFFSGLIIGLSEFLATLTRGSREVFPAFIELLTGFIQDVTTFAGSILTAMGPDIINTFESLRMALRAILEAMLEITQKVGPGLPVIFEMIADAADTLGGVLSFIGTLFEGFIEFVNLIPSEIRGVIASIAVTSLVFRELTSVLKFLFGPFAKLIGFLKGVSTLAAISGTSLTTLLLGINPVTAALGALVVAAGATVFIMHKMREQFHSSGDAAEKLAESSGLAWQMLAQASPAAKTAEASLIKFRKENTKLISQLKEMSSVQEQQDLLFSVGVQLVEHGNTPQEALETLRKMVNAADIDIDLGFVAEDLNDLGMAAEASGNRIVQSLEDTNRITGIVKDEVTDFSAILSNAFNTGRAEEAVLAFQQLEKQIKNSSASVDVKRQALNRLSDEFLKLGGFTDVSTSKAQDLDDVLQELVNTYVITEAEARQLGDTLVGNFRVVDETVSATESLAEAQRRAQDAYENTTIAIGRQMEKLAEASNPVLAAINAQDRLAQAQIDYKETLADAESTELDKQKSLHDLVSALLEADAAQRELSLAERESVTSAKAMDSILTTLASDANLSAEDLSFLRQEISGIFEDARNRPEIKLPLDMTNVKNVPMEVQLAQAKAKQRMMESWNEINVGVRDESATLVATVRKMLGDVEGEINNQSLFDEGVALVNSLKIGMNAAKEGLLSVMRNVAQSVTSTFSNVLEFGSPSKVFMDFGFNIVEGLALGIEANTARVRSAVQGLADVTLDPRPFGAGFLGAQDPALISQILSSQRNLGLAVDLAENLRERMDRVNEEFEHSQARQALVDDLAAANAEVQKLAAQVGGASGDELETLQEEFANAVEGRDDLIRSLQELDAARKRSATEARVALQIEMAANQAALQFEQATTHEKIRLLDDRIVAARAFTDEWMDLVQQRMRLMEEEESRLQQAADEAQQIFDSELAELNRMLDERERILGQLEDLEESHAQEVARIQERALKEVERLVKRREALEQDLVELSQNRAADIARAEQEAAEAIADARAKAEEAIAQAIEARRQSFFDELSLEAQSTQHLIALLESQIRGVEKWRDGLEDLRARGLTEAAIDQMGLEDFSEEALAQILMLLNATDEEIARINQLIADRAAVVDDTVASEQQNAASALAQEIAAIHAEMTAQLEAINAEKLAKIKEINNAFLEEEKKLKEGIKAINEEIVNVYKQMSADIKEATDQFLEDQKKLQEELANVGLDQGRSWAEAIAEGIASGLPGIQEQVRLVQAAFLSVNETMAALAEAQAQHQARQREIANAQREQIEAAVRATGHNPGNRVDESDIAAALSLIGHDPRGRVDPSDIDVLLNWARSVGALAGGGTAHAGRSYIVGEEGPELFNPGVTGTVFPNSALGGGGTTIQVDNIIIQIDGIIDPNDPEAWRVFTERLRETLRDLEREDA